MGFYEIIMSLSRSLIGFAISVSFIFLLLSAVPVNADSDSRICPTRTIGLSFVGDIMAHTPNFEMSDYNRIYDSVASYFQQDDLTFANLEAPVNDQMEYRTYPRFNVQSDYLTAAVKNGIEVFSIANNHINDWGMESLSGTQRAFEQLKRNSEENSHPLHWNGTRTRPQQPLISVELIPINDWRIGFTALTQFVNNSDATAQYVQIVDYRSPQQIERLLAEIKAVIADYDLFIVSYHGGAEYQREADDQKRQFFYQLAEAGVDVVWGHHPHVLQPWEVYQTSRGDMAVLMYSLGNFVSGQTWHVPADNPQHQRAWTGDSLIVQVCIQQRTNGLRVRSVGIVPISHYKVNTEERGGVEVRAYRDLLRGTGITPEWLPYYRARYAVLQEQYGLGLRE